MNFIGKITVNRYAENDWNPETTELFNKKFDAKSIQSAKAHLTRIANATKLFSWVQSWDNVTRDYTGKDLRWKPWKSPFETYTQDNDVEVAYSTRTSEKVSGETIYPKNWDRYGKSVQYQVNIALYWRA